MLYAIYCSKLNFGILASTSSANDILLQQFEVWELASTSSANDIVVLPELVEGRNQSPYGLIAICRTRSRFVRPT